MVYGLLGVLVLVGSGVFAIFTGDAFFIDIAVISAVVCVAAIVERSVSFGGMFYVAFGAVLIGLSWGSWVEQLLLPIATFGLGIVVALYGIVVVAAGPVGHHVGYWRDRFRRWVRTLTSAPPTDDGELPPGTG